MVKQSSSVLAALLVATALVTVTLPGRFWRVVGVSAGEVFADDRDKHDDWKGDHEDHRPPVPPAPTALTTKTYTTPCAPGVYNWVFCPDGYVATGGGGADCNGLRAMRQTFPLTKDPQNGNPLIAGDGDTPTGWFFETLAANPPYSTSAYVVCAPGP